MKESYGFPKGEIFYIPPAVSEFFAKAAERGNAKRIAWEEMFAKYTKDHPDKAAEISRRFANKLADGLLESLPKWVAGKDEDLATRQHSQQCIEAISKHMPELIGGSADLTPSNLTRYSSAVDFQKECPLGRYLRFGVREHGMVAICNGIFAYGGFRPYCATFLVFTGYCVGAIRLSALSKFGVIFVMTHDSIGLGEDGPTHQAIEILESLRCMPNVNVFRPADGNETAAAYYVALRSPETPTVICCSRSKVDSLETSSIEQAAKGAYVVVEEASPDLVIISTGSEVGPCVKAAAMLASEVGIKTRVVSMPCQEVFIAQPTEYQREVLPGTIPTLSVEASSVHGWHRFSHSQVSMGGFGLSGSGPELFDHFGFTALKVVKKGTELVEFYKLCGASVPDLNNRPAPDFVGKE
jgi:transketolase